MGLFIFIVDVILLIQRRHQNKEAQNQKEDNQ